MATLGISKLFILDKYFSEFQKFLDTQKKLQDSCEGQEAAQLQQRLRSLGCELVTLRSKLPPSIQAPNIPHPEFAQSLTSPSHLQHFQASAPPQSFNHRNPRVNHRLPFKPVMSPIQQHNGSVALIHPVPTQARNVHNSSANVIDSKEFQNDYLNDFKDAGYHTDHSYQNYENDPNFFNQINSKLTKDNFQQSQKVPDGSNIHAQNPPAIPAGFRAVPSQDLSTQSQDFGTEGQELRTQKQEFDTQSRVEDVEDLIYLRGPLTEDAVIRSLHSRFMTQHFYTNIGPMVLSINSFKEAGNPMTLSSTRHTPPSQNLMRVVHEAVRQQSETGLPQAIILSGCSGSGKTYTSMLLLRHLFEVAGGGAETDAFKHLSAAFTVLRSLGTAKTKTNSDSSRIGHFIEVKVSDGALYRTKIHCYFLDQSRVVRLAPDEKNYNIFYQLLAGLNSEEKVKVHLHGHSIESLNYLNGGDTRQNVADDAKRFEDWKNCLRILGIHVLDVIRTLSAILLLGNVIFVEGQGNAVDIQGGGQELKNIAALLGVSSAALYTGLTTRTQINVRGQLSQSLCDANMSNVRRDSLAKALYCRTLATIVRRANSLKRFCCTSTTMSSDSNESMQQQQADVQSRHSTVGTCGSKASKSMSVLNHAIKHATYGFIGILDMFGFESNEPSNLEHLCVNMCAETMLHFFNSHVFKPSIECCIDEGIENDMEIDYMDNILCIELLGNLRTGLLRILDLECSTGSTPENYVQRIRIQNKGNPWLFEPKSNSGSANIRAFGINHFAGKVVYDVSDFLDTNKDIISDDVISVFEESRCSFGFASHLFDSELKALFSQEPAPRGISFRISPTSHTALQNGYEPISTLTQDFHIRIDSLLRTLIHAKTHFVRCVRANNAQKPELFDRPVVIKQIRALQVLETVNLMACGFPHRLKFGIFSVRYRLLAPFKKGRKADEKMVDECRIILEHFTQFLDPCKNKDCTVLMQWAIGTRHVFLSEGARQKIEQLKIKIRFKSAVKIQSLWRGWTLRRCWPNLKNTLTLEMRSRTRGVRPRPQPITCTPPPDSLGRCSQKTIQQTCSRIGLDLERPPPVPASRSYTINGNKKLGYPQTRIMKMTFAEDSKSEYMLKKGQSILVVGVSNRRGCLVVEQHHHSFHVPFQYMELAPQSPAVVR